MNLDILTAQIGWSRRTFGPGPRVKGNTAHVLKELLEYREEPNIEEAVDIAMLANDGLWRQISEANPGASDEEIADMMTVHYDVKLAKNHGRAFQPTPPDVPSEGRPGKWKPTDAVFDVLAERRRHVEGEGWTPEHDDSHDKSEMTFAAIAYLMAVVNPNAAPIWWPSFSWSWDWFKPGAVRRMLVKAAALLIAEIERLDRKDQ